MYWAIISTVRLYCIPRTNKDWIIHVQDPDYRISTSQCLVWNKILLSALRLRSLLKYLLYEIHIKKNWKFVSQKSAEQIPVKCCSILCKVLYQALVIFYVNKFNLRQKYFTLARRTVLNDDFSPWAPCWWHSPVYKPRLYFTVSLD